MGQIRFNDRAMVLGYTGSGKSELINYFFSVMSGGAQRFMFDSKPEYSIAGVEPVYAVADIDWRQPIVHYKSADGAPKAKEVQRVFQSLNCRRRITVFVHELSDLCEYDANKSPAAVDAFLSKGRKFGRGLVGGTQRPVGVPKRSFTDIQHAFIFASGFPEQADLKAAAGAAGKPVTWLAGALEALHAEEGEHAFLHIDRRERTVVACPALTASERDAIIVDDPDMF